MDEDFQRVHEAYQRLQTRIVKSDRNGECLIWTGTPHTSGHGRIGVQNNDRSWKQVGCHRIAYMFAHSTSKLAHDVSHLCHNKLCANADHLSHEPRGINNNRQSCVNVGLCSGHGNYANCMLHLKLS